MARVLYHEHPRQSGRCLSGAFDAYVQRIPVEQYGSLDAVWRELQKRPFESDDGGTASANGDGRCAPVQRSRLWPPTLNCWEYCAHWTAGAKQFLSDAYRVNVWDADLKSGVRHVWPSLVLPNGRHLLIDLQTAKPTEYRTRRYDGMVLSANADTQPYVDMGLDLVGGVGGAVIGIFGGPEAGGAFSKGVGGVKGIVDKHAYGQPDSPPARVPSAQELEGRLVQENGNPRVYRVEDGKKRWVPSEAVMRSKFGAELVQGRWTGVLYVPAGALAQLPDGSPFEEIEPAPSRTASARERSTASREGAPARRGWRRITAPMGDRNQENEP